MGFEPTISASERQQTYALDRVATGTGNVQILTLNIFYCIPLFSRVPEGGIPALKHVEVSGFYDSASWAKYEERRPTRCNN